MVESPMRKKKTKKPLLHRRNKNAGRLWSQTDGSARRTAQREWPTPNVSKIETVSPTSRQSALASEAMIDRLTLSLTLAPATPSL
ncbi:hypothetical protein B0T21DRAFT_146011 [Apiosordaria backusii]|uniref:Uncharacterized protein n=1 Tax=Apiosordaria backusii TaxID=314023 RepID=A0AA40BSN8_9PEZI|nr:hypothetical protein B0T21DRAFT_146011 [Apiosordaria backusii]